MDEIGYKSDLQNLHDRVIQLERELMLANKTIAEPIIDIDSIRKVSLPRHDLHIEVLDRKIDILADAMNELMADLITKEEGIEPHLIRRRRVKIIHPPRLPDDQVTK